MSRRKILIVTDDVIGVRMAGPAIRAWNIAQVLSGQHDVRLASTKLATGSSPDFAVCDGRGDALRGLARGQDVIVLQGYTLLSRPWLRSVGARLVIDLYDPFHLELLEGTLDVPQAWQSWLLRASLDALQVQLACGDFFLCASERQRDLWLGHLGAAGRVNFATYGQDNTLRRLIDVAPFGIAETPPAARPGALRGVMAGINHDDQILLWAGGVYNWFDPVTLIEAVGQLVPDFPALRLVFLGTKHPSPDEPSTLVLRRAVEVAKGRKLLDRSVFFREGWVPYAERDRYLVDADIGVSTHLVHVETAYSFRTRMLDYLWAGLPIICTEGDEFAGIVARRGLGAAVPQADPDALAAALRTLLTDPAAMTAARAAVNAIAPDYRWSRALARLVDYCAEPWAAADLVGASRLAGQVHAHGAALRSQTQHVRAYVAANGWRRLAGRVSKEAGKRLAGPIRRARSR